MASRSGLHPAHLPEIVRADIDWVEEDALNIAAIERRPLRPRIVNRGRIVGR